MDAGRCCGCKTPQFIVANGKRIVRGLPPPRRMRMQFLKCASLKVTSRAPAPSPRTDAALFTFFFVFVSSDCLFLFERRSYRRKWEIVPFFCNSTANFCDTERSRPGVTERRRKHSERSIPFALTFVTSPKDASPLSGKAQLYRLAQLLTTAVREWHGVVR